MSDSRSSFHLEVFRLLLQVAWADNEVEAHEADALRDLADRYRLCDEDRDRLERYLSGQEALPPPNLGLLKSRKGDVMIALQSFLLSDMAVVKEERELLAEIELILERD